MKCITPVVCRCDKSPSYPSHHEAELARRGFLIRGIGALTAGVGVGAFLLLDRLGLTDATASARPGDASAKSFAKRLLPAYRVDIWLTYYFKDCDVDEYEVDKLMVYTADSRFASFLRDAKERSGIQGVMRQQLDKLPCRHVTSRRRVIQVENRIAQALATQYLQRRRRRTKQPVLALQISKSRSGIDEVEGDVETPAIPVVPTE